jgi:hypothetical protein
MAGDPKTDPNDSDSIDTSKNETNQTEVTVLGELSDPHNYDSIKSTEIQKQNQQILNRSQILNRLDKNEFNRHLYQAVLTACLGLFTVGCNYNLIYNIDNIFLLLRFPTTISSSNIFYYKIKIYSLKFCYQKQFGDKNDGFHLFI